MEENTEWHPSEEAIEHEMARQHSLAIDEFGDEVPSEEGTPVEPRSRKMVIGSLKAIHTSTQASLNNWLS